ncbi:GNAT family N-acetyltransferase [Aquimarina sp. ERC-38]|uniref:GNAT family N-acetyltransferase n=1 Tax=Aquimarina sp. ERC-38 TaxID=2949996 RepID=UPI0022476058|nr:GNAT family N-acetyltransferase [Aquimarina sp. ERC-38]UZO81826.1 GNAT family N-acetyltransferase [Aquimarina sp. ERC-38]
MSLKTQIKSFGEIQLEELYQILKLRTEVFVVEQDCVYQDMDNKDQKAVHIIGYYQNELAAYTRIFKPGDYSDLASIGRVVVDPNKRKFGFGKEIMNASIQSIYDLFGKQPITISAQCYLYDFYASLGFKQVSQEYLEDGIPHIRMNKD